MEATPEQTAEGLAIVRVLSAVLERLVDANGQHLHDPIHITKFHAMKAPGIAIQQYLERYVLLNDGEFHDREFCSFFLVLPIASTVAFTNMPLVRMSVSFLLSFILTG